MKYIRIKDKIMTYEELQKYGSEKWLNGEEIEILKQADTIEELCDEFVIADVEHRCWERVFKPALKQVLKDYEKPYEIYGAIWTDKGLIYVAKMNDKGELELL